jgi:hypothetical protein
MAVHDRVNLGFLKLAEAVFAPPGSHTTVLVNRDGVTVHVDLRTAIHWSGTCSMAFSRTFRNFTTVLALARAINGSIFASVR